MRELNYHILILKSTILWSINFDIAHFVGGLLKKVFHVPRFSQESSNVARETRNSNRLFGIYALRCTRSVDKAAGVMPGIFLA